MNELLKLEHIYFQYEERYIALNDVSATFHKGERVAILGNNGAGKSTFFLCCNGVLHPQKGGVFLNGREVTHSKKDVNLLRQAVGLVFQDPDSQIIAGTVEGEISFGPMNLGLDEKEVGQRVEQSMTQMNLTDYEGRAPQYLSGGEKKRVSIADILAMQPDMILLDEPTASLDPENVILLEEILDALSKEEIALVISTHDVDFAYRFAKRAIVFSQGKIIADTDTEEVFGSDEILSRAGLKKPLVYAAAEHLEKQFPDIIMGNKPKSIEELQQYISRLG